VQVVAAGMKLLVFCNPKAGHGDVPKDRLLRDLQRAGHEVEWLDKGQRKLSEVLPGPFEAVVVVGGDGSVGAVGRKLAGRPVPIAVVPAGTANNIARALGATSANLIHMLADGRTVPFDVGTVDGLGEPRRFLEGVGLGAFADTAALLSARPDEGVSSREDELSRDLHVLEERVRRLEPCACRLEFGGREYGGHVVLVEVTIGGTVGPNLQLSPDAEPGDGLLDIVLVDIAERDDLLGFLSARRRGESPAPSFLTARTPRATLSVPGGRCVHVDGDTVDVAEPVELRIDIEPAALRFFSARERVKDKERGTE
jgi:diacylglycerol kinase (ATP)